MYKPHTIEQYKIQRFLDETFAMEHFLVSPLSRTSLLLEDETGEQLAFGFLDDEVREIPLPPPAAPEEIKDFIRRFRALNPKPRLRTFEDITRWWLGHPNPLTYQQALGLSDELYRHFLSHPMIDEDDAYRLASSGLVSEDDYGGDQDAGGLLIKCHCPVAAVVPVKSGYALHPASLPDQPVRDRAA